MKIFKHLKDWHFDCVLLPLALFNVVWFSTTLAEKFNTFNSLCIVTIMIAIVLSMWVFYDSGKEVFEKSGLEQWVTAYGKEHKWFRQMVIFCSYAFILPIMIPIEFGKGLSYFLISFISSVAQEYCDFYKFLRNWRNV